MLKLIIDKNLQIRNMEEQIEELLLKEKSSLQVNTDPNLETQMSSVGIELSVALTTTDVAKSAQYLAIQK